ncbi:MAG: hypothetical protein J5641_04645 [Bacteroidales bacterium]|nr:hypothetical protein [Bacteroidales bacterium]
MKILRNLLKGVSLTAAMFVFQACYGTEPDWNYANMTFRVVSEKTGEPLPDIKVMMQPLSHSDSYHYDWQLLGYTDSTGVVSDMVADMGTEFCCRFSDNDSVYAVKDTIIQNLNVDTIDIVLSRID